MRMRVPPTRRGQHLVWLRLPKRAARGADQPYGEVRLEGDGTKAAACASAASEECRFRRPLRGRVPSCLSPSSMPSRPTWRPCGARAAQLQACEAEHAERTDRLARLEELAERAARRLVGADPRLQADWFPKSGTPLSR